MPGSGPVPVLELRDLCWSVGGADIVQGVELAVAEGEFWALIGPNGAGKTSLFNLVSGVNRPTGGAVLLDGRAVQTLPPHRRARLGVARSFQSSLLFPSMTVAEHVELAARAGGARGPVDTRPALERVRLAHRRAEPAAELSHGDKRKLELAMLLAPSTAGPRLMLLDEPMAGVASEEVAELTEVIWELHRGEGRTVLMVEHHLDIVLGLADRVAVMHHGRLLAAGAPDEVMADSRVQEAYVGELL
ncbi:ABC transporter ATP-binding protein [Streptomyces sp. NPDC005438]|uniref:ABC transporter ATP-binding protein n=1 Tax=Streptomyces sp. NPDC005438 TaxID=3156880 RepID=UPI0033B857C7